MSADCVFLFDVDNTLLDNDRVIADLRAHLARELGDETAGLYWQVLEEERRRVGYVDYLGALQEARRRNPAQLEFLEVSRFLLEYPFAHRLYAGAVEAVERAQTWGTAAILSDGDVVFQPRKVQRAGLAALFAGRVMIYVHKEEQAAEVARLYPARHYVLVDDKLRLLNAYKQIWGDRITTVWPRQGHYAHDPEATRGQPEPDVTVDRIGDFAALDRSRLVPEV